VYIQISIAALLLTSASTVFAQDSEEAETDPLKGDIIVTAPRIPGSIDTDVPAEITLNEDEIKAYGASSVGELLQSLGPQTRTGRGRGGGAPVVLINGRRVSGFAEIRELPPEAILKTEVFPEEVALRYGFSADQRVVNFILKPGFKSFSLEGEVGGPTRGGRSELEATATKLLITKNGRSNITGRINRGTAITEAERDIIAATALDDTAFRTLLAGSTNYNLNGTVNNRFGRSNGATVNLVLDRTDSLRLLGKPAGLANPLERDTQADVLRLGTSMDGEIGRLRWTLTGNADTARTRTLTDRVNGPQDQARVRTSLGNLTGLLAGPFIDLPAGRATVSLRAGYDRRRIKSTSVRGGVSSAQQLTRGDANGQISLDIPLASRDRSIAQPIGDLSINGNVSHRALSDFGGLTSYGYGLTWGPIEGVTFTASTAIDQGAPGQEQLGNPFIVTPGVTVFDFVTGQTVIADVATGGNAALRSEERRDIKLGMNITPAPFLSLSANYFRNTADNPISSFPVLTPAIEAAFPNRIQRNGAGQLIRLDQRPVNFASSRNDQIRWGFNLFGQFKPAPGAAPTGGRPPWAGRGGGGPGGGGGRPPGAGGEGAGGPPRTGGGGGGMGRFGPGSGGNGGWQFSAYHSLRLKDEITIAPGLAPLNLLKGDAIGSTGGSPRHSVDIEGGIFKNGMGMRAIGNWKSGTDLKGSGLIASEDLRFSSLFTLNLRMFMNLDQRKNLVKSVPFLKGSRIALRINNVFDTIQSVRTPNGSVPLGYQPGYLDPVGRNVEISFRKLF
jgi:iron complex outermembrane recepter protein